MRPPSHLRQAFVGVGANLGDRAATITQALIALAHTPGLHALESAAVFETQPVGITDQPLFLNLVIGLETTLSPESLLEVLLARERAASRNRATETRWGPRTLDLDLLLYENETRASPTLELPHPRMWDRPFVLAPLKDLLDRHPRFHRPAWDALRARLAQTIIPAEGITRWIPPEK
jgi:2-amino-4-hydroxy-6-hydroxymethyldihydropteridine diphosphokinase